jgi:hypothetical protein
MADKADITFSMSEDQTEVIFSASTPKGEEWMGAPEVTVPTREAMEYRQEAEGEA